MGLFSHKFGTHVLVGSSDDTPTADYDIGSSIKDVRKKRVRAHLKGLLGAGGYGNRAWRVEFLG